MNTFIFCTSYFEDNHVLKNRYKKWYDYYRKLTDSTIFCIDDASPFSLQDINWINLDTSKVDEKLLNFHTFKNNLGRISITNFPGWIRSFQYSIDIAKKFNFERIIHIESDFFILNKGMLNYLLNIKFGWHAVWCPKYNMPETALQVICEDQFESVNNIIKKYEFMNKDIQSIETILPFTNIIKKYTGDRYGETEQKIESFMDYYGQFSTDWKIQ